MDNRHGTGRAAEVRARLLDLVDRVPVGDALPGERGLAASWHVARMTLRRAVDELVVEGVLERRQGSGTFVAQPKVSRPLGLLSFSADMRRRGLRPSARLIEMRRVRAGVRAARQLRIPVGDEVVRLTRLRSVDETPMCVEAVSVAGALVPGLQPADLERGSWYELLDVRYGLRIITGSITVEPVLPEPWQAELLDVSTSQPCLMSKGLTFDRRGRVVEQGVSIARGDRYRLSVDLQPGVSASRPVVRGA